MTELNVDKGRVNRLLSNSVVVDFVKKLKFRVYRQCTKKQQNEIKMIYEKAFDLLVKNRNRPARFNETVDYIVHNLFRKGDTDFWFHKFRDFYSENVKGALEFKTIKKYIKGGTILDVGSGGGYLALKCSQEGYTVLTTDLLDHRADATKHLPFRIMTDPSIIPYPDNAADTALIFFALHHIDSSNLRRILKELKRVSSRVIVREDVYGIPSDNPEFKTVIEDDDLLQEFMSLPEEDQLGVLILRDFTDNALSAGIPEMNFPFQFKTIPEWNTVFPENGFNVVKTILLGFKRGRNWTGICHALFILDELDGPS